MGMKPLSYSGFCAASTMLHLFPRKPPPKRTNPTGARSPRDAFRNGRPKRILRVVVPLLQFGSSRVIAKALVVIGCSAYLIRCVTNILFQPDNHLRECGAVTILASCRR